MTGVAKQAPEIEFWFEFGSTCGYLTVMRSEEKAQRHGVRIVSIPRGRRLFGHFVQVSTISHSTEADSPACGRSTDFSSIAWLRANFC